MQMNKYPTRNPYCLGDEIPLCPHCGKPMTLLSKRQWEKRNCTHYPDSDIGLGGEGDYDLDDIWESSDPVQTYKCDEHSIKYLPHGSEWIFPKDYAPTITDKQANYIWYLSKTGRRTASPKDEEQFEYPYITSLELASQWISEHKSIVENQITDDELRTRVIEELKTL